MKNALKKSAPASSVFYTTDEANYKLWKIRHTERQTSSFFSLSMPSIVHHQHPGGRGILPNIGYIGMCGPKGYGFSAVLVINRVSILADFGHFGHK